MLRNKVTKLPKRSLRNFAHRHISMTESSLQFFRRSFNGWDVSVVKFWRFPLACNIITLSIYHASVWCISTIFDCFRHQIIPVVMGARRRDYDAVAPPHALIHVDDFAGPRQLASYLHLLANNDTLYNEYFRWRQDNWSPVDQLYWCRLCAFLHWRDEVKYVSWYDDYVEWWNGACRRPNNAPWFQRNKHQYLFHNWKAFTLRTSTHVDARTTLHVDERR